jgi:hypothetical protein
MGLSSRRGSESAIPAAEKISDFSGCVSRV